MKSALYRDTEAPTSRATAVSERQIATTAALVVMAVCMITAKVHGVEAQGVPQQNYPPAIRVVDPEFCKNQTWPYIDGRCLKRADAPAPSAGNVPIVPANAGQTTVAAIDSSSVAGSSTPVAPLAKRAPVGDAMVSHGSTPADSQFQPTTAAASPSGQPLRDGVPAVATDAQLNNTSAPPVDLGQPRLSRHARHHARFIFGFRF
jgi:hypothetical protein